MNENELVKKLIEKKFKIAFAESCTGGLLAGTIVNVPSASKVLDMSFVTYSNESKTQLCGVKKETIDNFGVVSENVASEMCEGVCKVANSNVGVGITGIAGPSGGTEKTPVGTVCFGFCVEGKITTITQVFSGDRNEIRQLAVNFAINTLLELLK